MSSPAPALDRLPEPLQIKIYRNLKDRDLLSLAVVNKGVSRIARPRLYLKSVLTIPPDETPGPDLWNQRWSRKQQDLYCETITTNPELGGQALSLYLSIYQDAGGFAEPVVEDEKSIKQIVGAVQKLQSLKALHVFQNRNVAFPKALLDSLPRSLFIVDLSRSSLSDDYCLELLFNLPLLKCLKAQIVPEANKPSYPPLYHSNLEGLALDLQKISPTFFRAITHDVPLLTTFETDFPGLLVMKGSPFLRRLKSLFIVGKQMMVIEREVSAYVDSLVSILSECPVLEHFAIHALYEAGIDQYITIAIEQLDIFQHIPPSVTSFEICGFLCKSTYLLSTITRLAPQLERLKISTVYPIEEETRHFMRGTVPDKAMEGEVKRICKENGVKFVYRDIEKENEEKRKMKARNGQGDCKIV